MRKPLSPDIPTLTPVSSAADRSRATEKQFASQAGEGRTQVEAASDEQRTAILHELTFGAPGQICLGVINYSFAHAGCYRVAINKHTEILCSHATSDGSWQPFGVRPTSALAPRSLVIVFIPKHNRWGHILGTIPRLVEDNEKFFADFINLDGTSGFKWEDYYGKDLFTLLKKGAGVVDFSMARPLDTTCLGEWGRITDLGGGIFIDPLVQWFRVDDTCGLWLFYMDRLARLAAYNMDVRTAISEQNVRNDEYEGMNFLGTTCYPWEGSGTFKPKSKIHKERDDKAIQYEVPYGKHEPEEDDLMPFYRYEEYRGYLGQAYMRQVMLPPRATGRNHYSDEDKRIGVFREQIGLDGSYALQSAHSIFVAKRVLIPVPKRVKLVEDDLGDVGDGPETESNYKFAGQFGDGDEHKITGHPQAQGEHKNLLCAAAFLDMQAHVFNWKSLHPFHYHKKDYDCPQEDEVPKFSELQKPPEFEELQSQSFMSQPTPVSSKPRVDDRYGEQEYWETTAGWALLPDGGYVLRDGYGSELRMSGGCIHMSCPGDIFLQPGRSFVCYAGDDFVARANKSIDVTAAQKDVRIKAEQNLEMLGANSGMGRTLIESRAVGINHEDAGKIGEEIHSETGIILKAKRTEISTMSQQIYLRTGNTDGGIGEGEIVVDACKGEQAIRLICSDLDAHCQNQAWISFPGGKDTIEKERVYRFGEEEFLVPCSTYIDGFLCNNQGGFLTKGNLRALDGHVITSVPDPRVWTFQNDGAEKAVISKITQDHEEQKQGRLAAFNTNIKTAFWEALKIGNANIQRKIEFGLRDEEQYGTQQFKLPEAYWQQWVRMGASGANQWTEPAVVYQGNETRPHPGNEKWNKEATFMEVDLQMWDIDNHRDLDRPGPYEDPEVKWKETRKIPDGYYPVITP